MNQRAGGPKKWRQRNRDNFHFKKLNRFQRLNRRRANGGQNRHHLTNKCRGGDCSPENLLRLNVWKHELWHRLFKNSDPEYIITVLQRLMRMKNYRMQGLIHSVETSVQTPKPAPEFEPEQKEQIKHQIKTGRLFILPGEKLSKYA
jgi:hypothetical protein